MTDLFDESEGATPLDIEDREALIPTWVATRADLNAVEQESIAAASAWAATRSWSIEDFDLARIKDLHKRMFGDVWRWAGRYRTRITNIGVEPRAIALAVEDLLRDLRAQVARRESLGWSEDEICVRFHYRLVTIHPFPNGNGRHARFVADLLARALGQERFSWGSEADLATKGPARRQYLDALRAADAEGDFAPLLEFARS